LARFRKVGIARDGLDFVRDVVPLQQSCQDLASTDRVGFEGDKDEYGCRLRMVERRRLL